MAERQWWRVLLAALLVVAMAAACGGDDDDEPTDVGSGDNSGDASGDGSGDGSGDAGDLASLLGDQGCAGLIGLYSAAFAGGAGDNDALEALAEDGPDELRDDFAELAAYLRGYFEALEDANIDPDEAADPANALEIGEALAEWQENVDAEALEEASANIEAWATEECPTLVE
jgi:hypothetical protein